MLCPNWGFRYAHAGAPPSEFRAEPAIWAADAGTGATGGVGVVIINIGDVSVPVEMTGSHTRYVHRTQKSKKPIVTRPLKTRKPR